MANPALNAKKFEEVREDWQPGWASPAGAAAGATTETAVASSDPGASSPALPRTGVMTANGTFAKTFALFLLVLAGGVVGWQQVNPAPAGEQAAASLPGWTLICLFAAFGVAMVCIFKPKLSPFLGPVYAVLEGVFLGALSKLYELQWHGIVFQAVLAVVAVFFVTLALYVFGVVKVTRKFQMVVIGATGGILLLYVFAFLLTIFGVDVTFWNDPSPLGIGISVVICCVAALNLFLDYEFIRQSTIQGAPKYMEWYGAFGIMVTLVWLYLEMLRLLSLLNR
jgi:uncharacterized YccA/Bax inhibitor family protein